MTNIEVVDLWPVWTNCTICGRDTLLNWYLPMYEGKVIDVDISNEWAGMPVCKQCYKDQTK